VCARREREEREGERDRERETERDVTDSHALAFQYKKVVALSSRNLRHYEDVVNERLQKEIERLQRQQAKLRRTLIEVQQHTPQSCTLDRQVDDCKELHQAELHRLADLTASKFAYMDQLQATTGEEAKRLREIQEEARCALSLSNPNLAVA
jgi:hypothetical protein